MAGEDDDQGLWQSPQDILAGILEDDRWDRQMLEDWFNKKDQVTTKLPSFTPDPERRALYLILLKKLEQQGKDRRDSSTSATTTNRSQMQVDIAVAQKSLPGNTNVASDDDPTPTQATFDRKSALESSSLSKESDMEDVPLEGQREEEQQEEFEIVKNRGSLKDLY